MLTCKHPAARARKRRRSGETRQDSPKTTEEARVSNPLFAPLIGFLGRLRYPKLFLVIGVLFFIDLLIPNFVPWDDILLGVGTLVLSRIKDSKVPEKLPEPEPRKPSDT